MTEENQKTSGKGRGGKREGAGRPLGSTKTPTVVFYRRVTAEEKLFLEKCLERYRSKQNKV